MYSLVFTEIYLKREKEFLKKHKDLIPRYKKVLKLLELDPHHPSLRLHKLKGKFKDKYSVSITMSYRIILTFVIVKKEIVLIDIGHHDEVY
ncbi:plasmid stabilization system [Deferribacter desulfuricans SSM1]|uniref:Plasmid stabilization system n=1 Tax=Deferribacter desulfuricans (strain DSM 14783 / JCM 11476 / NBRC 101012 / SSM1) TaxID=639282 RepID=D3PBQ9_DEFDS|nr:type II toxin-antitoxin system mRNA interferase toxin, RelE/StbE family [Deferribacter desulfuricans]BAI80032.1 plasmid stabilization system [Deferribacter desulfuricans SSM1]